jgi:hypothetical protein
MVSRWCCVDRQVRWLICLGVDGNLRGRAEVALGCLIGKRAAVDGQVAINSRAGPAAFCSRDAAIAGIGRIMLLWQ